MGGPGAAAVDHTGRTEGLAGVEIDNRMTLFSGGCNSRGSHISMDVSGEPGQPRVIFSGKLANNCSEYQLLRSLLDGIGMSIGFGVVITLMGAIREFLGAGTLFNRPVLGAGFTPILVFILPPGAFLVLGFLIAAQKRIAHAREAKT